ncbi:MAG: CPBP family intramembrane metalloprotease [Chloroflexales bacterium]|nr:CPBP family intramembrane metalloprotease [Chloroflexales bacterium]
MIETAKLVAGFAIIYLVLDRSATWTRSAYGEYGLLICVLVIAAGLLVERWLFGRAPHRAFRALGFGQPGEQSLLAAGLISLVLLAALPLFAIMSGQTLTLRSGWLWIALGVLAQGGIAEEVLWRGYLFRHLRTSSGFWRAAAGAMLFMVLQHMLLLWSLPLPVALAALIVALLSSFPLAYLFEVGGGTIWGAALVHAVIQGGLKVAVVPEEAALLLQLSWMTVSVAVPYLVFLLPRSRAEERA